MRPFAFFSLLCPVASRYLFMPACRTTPPTIAFALVLVLFLLLVFCLTLVLTPSCGFPISHIPPSHRFLSHFTFGRNPLIHCSLQASTPSALLLLALVSWFQTRRYFGYHPALSSLSLPVYPPSSPPSFP